MEGGGPIARWEEEEEEEGDVNSARPFGKKAREEAMKLDPEAPLLFEEEA